MCKGENSREIHLIASPLVLFDLIWFDLIWFDLILFDLIWFDLILFYLSWFDLIWFDLVLFDLIWSYLVLFDLIWSYLIFPAHSAEEGEYGERLFIWSVHDSIQYNSILVNFNFLLFSHSMQFFSLTRSSVCVCLREKREGRERSEKRWEEKIRGKKWKRDEKRK